jgi:putative aldouronate transport system substrate-binding protein
MKTKKILAAILCLGMLLTVLAGCTGATTTTTARPTTTGTGATTAAPTTTVPDKLANINLDSQFPVVHDEITLKLMGARAASQGEWEDLKFFKVLQERSNIKLEFVTVPSENWEERKNLAFASDNLPDIFFGVTLSANDETTYGPQGYLLPLEDLIENYSVNFKALLQQQPTVKQDITTPDGHIYTLPYVNDMPRDLTEKIWFNKAWTDELGIAVPTTTEELYNVFKAFKDGDPNKNGDTTDEIPLSLKDLSDPRDLRLLMSYWGLTVDPGTYIANKNDSLVFAPNQPVFKDFLLFMNKLFAEGLIDVESFTQTNEQLRAKGKQDVQVLGAFVNAGAFLVVPEDQNEDYIALAPLKTPEGTQEWIKLNPVRPGAFAITKNADEEKAVAAMRMVDWVYGAEGALVLLRGIEDEDYVYTNAERTLCEVIFPDRYSNFQEYRAKELTPNAGSRTPGIGAFTLPVVFNALNDYINVQVDENLVPYWKQPLPLLYFSDDDQKKIASVGADVKSYVVQSMARFISGDLNIETGWDGYLSDLNRMGINDYMAIYQAAYDVWKSNS